MGNVWYYIKEIEPIIKLACGKLFQLPRLWGYLRHVTIPDIHVDLDCFFFIAVFRVFDNGSGNWYYLIDFSFKIVQLLTP